MSRAFSSFHFDFSIIEYDFGFADTLLYARIRTRSTADYARHSRRDAR